MANVVASTLCPECGRNWTGSFPEDDIPKEKVCKDCKQKKADQ